jgi:hypothetical protein
MWLARSNKAASEGFFGFHKAMRREGKGKEGNLPTAWHLMPPDKHLGKQGCNFWFRDHEIFNPRKSMSVNICPSVFVHVQFHQFFIVICCQFVIQYLFVVIHRLVSCFVFTFIHSAWSFWIRFCFCSVSSDYSLFDYSVLFSVLILEMYSRNFNPHNSNHPASQVIRHYTTRLHHLMS